MDALTRLEQKVESYQKEVTSMRAHIQVLESRIDELENHSRRTNLIVYGVPEVEKETGEMLEHAVNNEIIENILELKPVAIERIHRLGRPESNKTRPVIFKLLDTRDKSSILKNGYKLKGTNFSIGEDFSKKIREVRKKLWDSAKPNRDKKDKVALAFTKLYINDKAYVWDSDKGERVPLQKNEATNRSRPMTRQHAQTQGTSH